MNGKRQKNTREKKNRRGVKGKEKRWETEDGRKGRGKMGRRGEEKGGDQSRMKTEKDGKGRKWEGKEKRQKKGMMGRNGGQKTRR